MKKAIVPLGIILLFVFGIFMYFNRFTIFHVSDVDGYIFDTNDIATNLSSGVDEDSPEITFETVKINDNIYKSGKKYYIGEENKKNVVLDYPVISEDDSSVLVLNDTGYYVEETFVKTETYPNTIINDGTLYNGINNTKADEAKYIFLDLGNGVYVNLLDIKIIVNDEEKTIPAHSFIYFERNFLRYYFYSNGVYKYREIAGIKDYDDITVDKYTYDYYDFLIYLGVLERPDLKQEEEVHVEEPIAGTGAGNVSSGTTTDSIQLPPPLIESNGANFVDKEYVKPEVKFSNSKASVYSWSGDLEVYDPADRIYKNPVFEFRYKGQVYMRSSFSRTMRIETTGLMPDTEYEVYSYYQYLNHNDQKMEVKIYEGKFKTKNTSELEPLIMEIGEIVPSVKQAEFKEIKLKNDANSEVLKGLKDGKVKVDDYLTLLMDYGQVNLLSNLKPTTFDTGETLKSGRTYNGTIVMYDVAGNEMPIKGNNFTFTTLKTPPVGKLGVDTMDRNFTRANIRVTLSNPDDVIDDPNSYKLVVYDDSEKIVYTEKLKEPTTISRSEMVPISNLKPRSKYTLRMFCDYYDASKGWIYNYELANKEMFTEDFAILGTMPVEVDIEEEHITSNSAHFLIRMPEYDINEMLYMLMAEDIPVNIINSENSKEQINLKFKVHNTIAYDGKIEFMLSPECSEEDLEDETCFEAELDSNTEYIVKVEPYIAIDEDEKYTIPTRPTEWKFITKKQAVKIFYANGYIAEEYVDFDICIEDKDGVLDVNEDGLYNPKKVQFEFVRKELSEEISDDSMYIQPRKSCTIPTKVEDSSGTDDEQKTPTSTDSPKEEEETVNLYENYTRLTSKRLKSDKKYSIVYTFEEYNFTRERINIQYGNPTPLIENVTPKGSTGSLKLIELTNQVNYNIEVATAVGSTQSGLIDDVNLFDISNNSRWIFHGDAETPKETKELKLDENEIVFTTTESEKNKAFSYYIPELTNQDYVIKFENSLTSGATAMINTVDNFGNDADTPIANISFNMDDYDSSEGIKVCSSDSTETDCDLYQNGKYITFYLKPKTGGDTIWTIKNLKINIGTTPSESYSDFGAKSLEEKHTNSYAGKFDVQLIDVIRKNDATAEKYPENFYNADWNYKYYIEYIVDGVSITDYLIEITEENQDSEEEGGTEGEESVSLDELITQYAQTKRIIKESLTANKNFDAEIGVEIEYDEGYYKKHVLRELEFSTETETRTINTPSEFVNMHPYGYYYLDLEDETTPITCSNADGSLYSEAQQAEKPCINLTGYQYPQTFQGSVDFQGYNVQLNYDTAGSSTMSEENITILPMFKTLGGGAIIKNIDLSINLHANTEWNSNLPLFTGIARTNNGLISNANVTIDLPKGFYQPRTVIYEAKSTTNTTSVPKYYRDTGHSNFSLITATNNGIIENFVIELKSNIPLLTNSGLVSVTNNGVIRNGYMTGKNILTGYRDTTGTKAIGALTSVTTANSSISNIYSTIEVVTEPPVYSEDEKKKACPTSLVTCDVDFMELTNESDLGIVTDEDGNQISYLLSSADKSAANLVHTATNAYIKNALIVDPNIIPENRDTGYYKEQSNDNRILTKDFIVSNNENSSIENVFYTGNVNTKNVRSAKSVDFDALKSETFFIQTINEDDKFDTARGWSNVEFPKLVWPDVMPDQLNIDLPETSTSTRLEIISVSNVIQMSELETNAYLQKITSQYSLNPEEWFAVVEIGLLNPGTYYRVISMKIEGISDNIETKNGSTKNENFKVLSIPTANDDGMQTIMVAIKKPTLYKQKYVLQEIITQNKHSVAHSPYLCSYTDKVTYSDPTNCKKQPILELDLYREVESYDDLKAAINEEHTNFRLINDIKVPSTEYLHDKNDTTKFSGILDGNGHKISSSDPDANEGELISKNCWIPNLAGTIRNINIDKHTVIPQKTSTNVYSGLVCQSETGGLIDNVHIGEVNTAVYGSSTGKELYIGGLIANSSNAVISNSSVSNMSISDEILKNIGSKYGSLNIGGLVGAGNVNIENSFVRQLNLDLQSATSTNPGYESLTAAGGIVGNLTSGNIENVYSTGMINSGLGSASKGIGGITGYTEGFIRTAISRVNIYANSDRIGGITGGTVDNSSYLSKTLVFGDVLTLMDEGTYSSVDRTSGTVITKNQNYAWYYQSKNSEVTPNTTMEELIKSEEFQNPTLYETKLGLNQSDFTIKLNDYSIFVVDENRYNHVVPYTSIKEYTNESGQIVRYFEKDSERIIIFREYATIPQLLHTKTGKKLNNQEFEIDPLTNDEKSNGDYVINYVATFNITSTPVVAYKKMNNGEAINTTKEYAEFVDVTFFLEVSDPMIDMNNLLYFGITDMVPYCEVGDTECEKSDYIPVLAEPKPDMPAESGCTNKDYCYYVSIRTKAAENKNYVNYTLSEIKYKSREFEDLQVYRTKIKLKIPFYGRIENVCDWQKIMYGTYQNYSVVKDVDFAYLKDPAFAETCPGISTTPNMNLSFENLVGVVDTTTGYVPTIKGLNVTNQPHGTSLIKTVNSEMKGVNFSNITIIGTTASGSNIGLIHTMKGKMYGHNPNTTSEGNIYMNFEDITIKATKTSRVGIIANNQSPLIEYIKLKNINVEGYDNVGGFIGYSQKSRPVYDVYGENLKVKGHKFIGGVIGYEVYYGWTRYTKRFQINGVNIYGTGDYIGGVYGYGSGDYIILTGKTQDDSSTTNINESEYNTVTGNVSGGYANYLGGIAGDGGNHGTVYIIVKNLNVVGRNYTGGLFGNGAHNTYSQSILNRVHGRFCVGGIDGHYNSYTIKAVVAGTSITGTYTGGDVTRVGGVTGYSGWSRVEDSQVGSYVDENGIITRTTIEGYSGVGGIVGYGHRETRIYRSIVNADITGKYYVGGLMGFANNSYDGSDWMPIHFIENNVVANSTITAESTVSYTEGKYYFVGGLIGRVYKRLDGAYNKNNLISATIKAGTTNANPATLKGVGYVVGGSRYTHTYNTTVTETIKDENGEEKKVSVKKPITYNFTQPFGDIFVGSASIGGTTTAPNVATNFKNTKVYENTTLNGVPIKEAAEKVDETIYKKVLNKYNSNGNIKLITEEDLRNLATYKLNGTNQYYAKSAYDKQADGTTSPDNKLTYFPYQKNGTNGHYIFKESDLINSKWTRVNTEITRDLIDTNLPKPSDGTTSASSVDNIDYQGVPDFDIYAVDVDKINIEFKNVNLSSFFTLNGKRYQINQTVFTFYYDFKEDFEIKLTSGLNEKTITIKADEIKNGVSVIGNYYYYLDDGEIVTNDPSNIVVSQVEPKEDEEEIEEQEEQIVVKDENSSSDSNESDASIVQPEESEVVEEEQVAYNSPGLLLLNIGIPLNAQNKLEKSDSKTIIENATNIYEGKVLLDNQNIYDIATGETTENSFENLTLAETSSLYDFTYEGTAIQTYKNYSVIDGKVINKQIIVKGNQIEVIEQQGQNNSTNQFIVDTYNDKNFLLYLGTDGKIHSLKDDIKYPSKFKNVNIKNISTNLSSDTNMLFVEYKDGSYLAFNYITGQIVSKSNNEPMNLIDYIKQELQISGDSLRKTSKNESYEETQRLISQLNEKSIDQVLRGDGENSTPELYSKRYTVSYDPSTGDYKVYEIPTKSNISGSEKKLADYLSTDIESIIDNNPKLLKFYKGDSYTKVNSLSSIIITIGIIVGIIFSTIWLGKVLKKRKKINA